MEYYDPSWGLHQDAIMRQNRDLAKYGVSQADLQAASDRYDPSTVDAKKQYRENEKWKNQFIEKNLFSRQG